MLPRREALAGLVTSLAAARAPAQTPLPIRRLRSVVLLGDSYEQHASRFGLSGAALNAAHISLLNVLAGQPFSFNPATDNLAVSGGTTVQQRHQLAAAIALKPDIIMFGNAHNDIIRGTSSAPGFSATIANLTFMTQTIISAGITPVILLDPPINENESSPHVTMTELLKAIFDMNQWKRTLADGYDMLVWDRYSPMVDLATGRPMAGTTNDNIHPNLTGELLLCQQGLVDLASLVGEPSKGFLYNGLDVFDPSYCPQGNLAPSPWFLSSQTNAIPKGVTGSRPVRWNLQASIIGTGKSIVSSVVSSGDGFTNLWQVVISGITAGGGNSSIDLAKDIELSNLSIGDLIEGFVYFSVMAKSPFCEASIALKQSFGDGKVITNYGNTAWDGGRHAGPNISWGGFIYVPKMAVQSGINGLIIKIYTQWNDSEGNFSGTIRFGRPIFRKAIP